MTVTRGGRTGRPRCSPDRAQDRRAHGGHRDAPWDDAPQSIQSLRTRRWTWRWRLLAFFAFFLERLAALLAHRSQYAASLGAGVPHRPHKPAVRRAAYCSRSLSRRATWHGSHTVPPSMGGCVPQRVHVRASRRARSRRLPLSRANARHRSASLPQYGMPAALAFAHLARSALRRFSPQCRHKVRSGAGLAFPHLGHMPRVIRSAVMRS